MLLFSMDLAFSSSTITLDMGNTFLYALSDLTMSTWKGFSANSLSHSQTLVHI